jgi:CCR4-NOT transcription complex subunit 7/8
MAHFTTAKSKHAVQIRPVWGHNLEKEFQLIAEVAPWFPCATIDTEFPGVIYEAPTHPRHMTPHQRYALVKKNVDRLKLIQLGLTLSTSDGNSFITWEFNFRGFDQLLDPHAPSSVKLLESQGMDLWKINQHGVDRWRFAYFMKSSGLLFNPTMTWIGFHMAYDMGYLVKVLTGADLPESMETFLGVVHRHFGLRIFDIKHLCKSCQGLEGGLEKVAGVLNVQRTAGTSSHNAGSDSLLTWNTFRSLRTAFLRGGIMSGPAGVLFGIQES